MTTTVDDCKVIELPRTLRSQGNLTAVEAMRHIPFDIARVYYLYDVPGGETRGGHAHKTLEQLIVCCIGSFDVVLDDGTRQRTVSLNRSYYGLYLTPGIWRELRNFSSGGVCLVLASQPYTEADYIREYSDFLAVKPSL